MKLSGKNCLVTGGGQGIGKATAKALLNQGARVIIVDSDSEAGKETAAEYAGIGDIDFLAGDVGDENSVAQAARLVDSRFGSLDLLVNNAGFMTRKPISELTLDEWNRVIAVDLTGAFLMVKHCLPYLRKAKGVVVNIASTRALMSEADTESYSAAKGGLLGLTHALAVSLGPEVRVNAISPGWIETGEWKKSSARVAPNHSDADRLQHPAGRVGVPDDIANLIVFLASPENSFVTGQNFVIDGGMTKKMIYVE